VTFTLLAAQFAFWDAGRWRIEPGEIQLMVGASSTDVRARAAFRIAAAGEGREPAAAIFTPSCEEPVRLSA
jgi:beta-glucosidase